MIVSATVVVIDEFGPDLSTERLAAAAGLHRMLQNGYRVDAGKETLTSTNRLQVTVTKVQGQWLLSAVTNVPLL